MPRQAKPARLWLQPARRGPDGRVVERPVWCIRDHGVKRSTGFGEGERDQAENALARYIANKYRPSGERRPERVTVAEALAFYLKEYAPRHRSAATTAHAAERILEWWGTRALTDIRSSTCRAYAEHRTGQSIPSARTIAARRRTISSETVRRELTVLRAAVNAYHAEFGLHAVPIVSLPEASPGRERFLTRSEAAAFLRAVRHHPDQRARLALSRFFLIGVYTGSRSGVIRALTWERTTSGGWIDLDTGVLYRTASGARLSKKRAPPVRIPVRLLAHLRRWHLQDHGVGHVVHYGATQVKKQRRAWDWARRRAGLGNDVVPHTLRHTAATWIMQAGPDHWHAAGYLGMSPETLWRVYGHHHPDYQAELAKQIGRHRRVTGDAA